jgi:hypothetical protein
MSVTIGVNDWDNGAMLTLAKLVIIGDIGYNTNVGARP